MGTELVFTFELENVSTAKLAYSGWPGIGGQLAGGILPGQTRKFRANAGELRAVIQNLERAAAADNIRLRLLSSLSPERIAFLRDLQSEVIDDLLPDGDAVSGKKVFLSHAAADKDLAALVAGELTRRMAGAAFFVASRTGDIRAGDEWYETIKARLREADVYLALLTPRSIRRPWVIFETGAAWMSDRQVIPVTAGGLSPSAVEAPLSFQQVYSLDDEEEARHVLEVLEAEADNLEGLCAAVRDAGQATQPSIPGLEFEGGFLAWDSVQLELLPEIVATSAPQAALNALKKAGHYLEFRLERELDRLAGKGLVPVYETDREQYRRKLLYPDGEGVLVILRSED